MSRLKKIIKIQSHHQFALQQLSAESRVSEEIKQFHSEQIEFADREGVVKALNFLLSLVKNTMIPVSEQIRSQVSKLVSLIRIRDELQLHAQIRKRELENEVPLMLMRECPVEFPHWDEIFVMLKMKKYSITFMEDHRARQELIASILRREAEIERKKASDAELKAALHAAKEVADQILMQKSLDAAREKSQRSFNAAKEKEQQALDAAKEKEQRALDAAKEKEQRALDAAKEREQRALDAAKERDQRALEEAANESKSRLPTTKELELASVNAANAKTLSTQDVSQEEKSRDVEKGKHMNVEQQKYTTVTKEQPLVSPHLNSLNPQHKKQDEKLNVSDTNSKKCEDSQQLKSVFCITDQRFANANEVGSSRNEILPSKAPCQSPKSIEHTPRQLDYSVKEPKVIICSRNNPVLFQSDKIFEDEVIPHMQANIEIPHSEAHQSNPQYGPWRPFISSSRYLQSVDEMETNMSPYEMALNLSCLAAVHSFPMIHGTSNLKNQRMETSSKDYDVFEEIRVPKPSICRNALPQLQQLPTNSKLLEDMTFEEIQLDRALRALRRCTYSSNKMSVCAYEEILQHQRKLMSLLHPIVYKNFKGDDQRHHPPSFDFVRHENAGSNLIEPPRTREHFSDRNCLPLKTNLAAQRRQVLLAKCSRFSSNETLSSKTADILHLESMANAITNHNRGDPTLWKSEKRNFREPKSQHQIDQNNMCKDIIHEVEISFGSAHHATKSLLLGNFSQQIKSSLNRSFRERYSAAGRSIKR